MNKTLVQEQFGKNAAGYLTSKPHAQGQKPGAAGRTYLAAKELARARCRHRRRPRRLHFRAACRARLGDRHHPGNARHGQRRSRQARARQCAHHLRQGRGAAVRGRQLRSRHLPHRAASLRLDPAIPRRSAPRAQAGRRCSRWSTMWCRPAASAITSMPSSACAIPATCAPGPWTNGARRSKTAGSAVDARGTDLQDDGIQELGAALRRDHEGAVARHADAGDARGESRCWSRKARAKNSLSACAKACSSPSGSERPAMHPLVPAKAETQ